MLVDTHAHIHDLGFKFNTKQVLAEAAAADVDQIICIGTTVKDSQAAIKFCEQYLHCHPTVGLHPHESKHAQGATNELSQLANTPGVVAVGECGLDYYYQNSAKSDQKAALKAQFDIAKVLDLPMVFHVRDGASDSAFNDFWKIYDSYPSIKGVVHSFTSTQTILKEVLSRGLYVALNGIMTFTKDLAQLEAAKSVPLDKLVLETDSPFLTPTPYRGKINTPANVEVVAKFLADLRGESFDDLASATTQNAMTLFRLNNEA